MAVLREVYTAGIIIPAMVLALFLLLSPQQDDATRIRALVEKLGSELVSERDEAVLADGRRLRPDVVVAEACGKPRFQNYGSATARLRRDLAQVATGWGP